MACPSCGAPLRDGQRRCPACAGDRAAPGRASLERAGIASGRSVALRLGLAGLGVAALAGAAVVAAGLLDGEAAGPVAAAPDAGFASAPIEIGLPVIVGREAPDPDPDPAPRPAVTGPAGTSAAASGAAGRPPLASPRPRPRAEPPARSGAPVRPREPADEEEREEEEEDVDDPAAASPAGGRDTAAIAAEYMARARAVVRGQYQGSVQRCFNAAMATNPSVRGRVQIGLMMGPQGNVLTSRVVSNDTGHPEIGQCIATAARSWRLPPPPRNSLEMQLAFSVGVPSG